MLGRQAKPLTPTMLKRTFRAASQSRHPLRNRLIILLSVKAGLRACEISGLKWWMVFDACNRVSSTLAIPDGIAKRGSGRVIPMHVELKRALQSYRRERGQVSPDDAIIGSERGGHMSAGSVVNLFAQLYRDTGPDGCSSHSGRRAFITLAARKIVRMGGSLRDVQELAGHRSLEVTERYIVGDRAVQRRLIDQM